MAFKRQNISLKRYSTLFDFLVIITISIILITLYTRIKNNLKAIEYHQQQSLTALVDNQIITYLDISANTIQRLMYKSNRSSSYFSQITESKRERVKEYILNVYRINSRLRVIRDYQYNRHKPVSIFPSELRDIISSYLGESTSRGTYLLSTPYYCETNKRDIFALIIPRGNSFIIGEIDLKLIWDVYKTEPFRQMFGKSVFIVANSNSSSIRFSSDKLSVRKMDPIQLEEGVLDIDGLSYIVHSLSLPFYSSNSFLLTTLSPVRKQLDTILTYFFIIIFIGFIIYGWKRIWEKQNIYRPLQAFINTIQNERTTPETSDGYYKEWNLLIDSYGQALKKATQLKQDLNDSEERRRLAMEAANDGLWDYNQKSDEIYFSPKWFSMLGYEVDEFPHEFQTWLDLVHPEDRSFAEYMIQTNLQEGRNFSIEYRMKRKKGGWIWIYSRGKVVDWDEESGKALRVIGTHTDITDFKETIDALFESEERFRNLVEVMPDALILVNDEKRIIYANPASIHLIGGTAPDQVVGKSITDFILADDEAMVENRFFTLIKIKEQVPIAQVRMRKLDGDLLVAESLGAPVKYETGIAVMYVLRDITERIKQEEQIMELTEDLERRVEARTLELRIANEYLQESLEKLQMTQEHLVESEKMAALGGLVAGVAHEINTPVGVSVTASSYLHEETETIQSKHDDGSMKRSDLEQYVKTSTEATTVILTNLKRAAELISSFKRVAVDQSTEDQRDFNIKRYINEVLLSLGPELKRNSCEIEINGPDNLNIYSYPGAFSQIITNMVMNSLIHGIPGTEEGILTFNLDADDRFLYFEYKDNGKGMSDEALGKVFEPFFTTGRSVGGSGLGMYIVYNIVTQKLGGKITCQSPEHKGVIFNIRVPLADPSC